MAAVALLLVATGALGLGLYDLYFPEDAADFDDRTSDREVIVVRGAARSAYPASPAAPDKAGATEVSQGHALPLFPRYGYLKTAAQSSQAGQGLQYTFPVRYPLTNAVGAVVIGDLDGDRQNDVAVAYVGSDNRGKVTVFHRGATGLVRGQTYDLNTGYNSIFSGMAVGDLNHDGKDDLAVATEIGVCLIVSGPAGHAPTMIPSDMAVRQIGMMDINRDGHLDVIGMHWGDFMGSYMPNASRMYFGDGAGGIARIQDLATPQRGHNDLKIGDVTSDGVPDLVIASRQAFHAWVIPHNGVDGFKQPVAYPNPSPRENAGVAIADVNSDGANDVVVAVYANVPVSSLWVYLQLDGALAAPFRMESLDLPGTMIGHDLNGDGRQDIAVLHEGWGEMGVYLQNAERSLQPEVYASIVPPTTSGADMYNRQGMAIGDITGDNCPDVAIGDYNWGLIVLEGRNCVSKPRHKSGPMQAELAN